jgi:hypothetical protein
MVRKYREFFFISPKLSQKIGRQSGWGTRQQWGELGRHFTTGGERDGSKDFDILLAIIKRNGKIKLQISIYESIKPLVEGTSATNFGNKYLMINVEDFLKPSFSVC